DRGCWRAARPGAATTGGLGALGLEAERVAAVGEVVVTVGCEEDCEARAGVERRPESVAGRVVEGSGRLVEDEAGRFADERAGEGELLDHPGRAVRDALRGDVVELELLGGGRDGSSGGARTTEPQACEEEKVLTAAEA